MTSADAPAVPPAAPIRDRALGIIATATLLALLYFARDVLVPVTLAIILSLLIAPLVRALRRVGLGQTLSVLAAVLMLLRDDEVGAAPAMHGADKSAGSLGHAVQTCLDMQEKSAQV